MTAGSRCGGALLRPAPSSPLRAGGHAPLQLTASSASPHRQQASTGVRDNNGLILSPWRSIPRKQAEPRGTAARVSTRCVGKYSHLSIRFGGLSKEASAATTQWQCNNIQPSCWSSTVADSSNHF